MAELERMLDQLSEAVAGFRRPSPPESPLSPEPAGSAIPYVLQTDTEIDAAKAAAFEAFANRPDQMERAGQLFRELLEKNPDAALNPALLVLMNREGPPPSAAAWHELQQYLELHGGEVTDGMVDDMLVGLALEGIKRGLPALYLKDRPDLSEIVSQHLGLGDPSGNGKG
ncbi:hypothetical protein A2Z33_03610 [Candidatus Gottesmanbacteria bacterium RBG_16_52_11]|uniref:Uncharacterized protein n=1 Tax=Candidatus Gottesmanbacteria bacterium RBG_16_52_11 TaxID=1798374 RepID=A0A1F5YVU4_9BACT|nr:MAG: hypothetical protein A2Z33_03610 [Candidatus Gottesmanbacteria bacterium RBG_16_52_11]